MPHETFDIMPSTSSKNPIEQLKREKDKRQHLSVIFFLTLGLLCLLFIASRLCKKYKIDVALQLAVVLVIVSGVSIGKEVWDAGTLNGVLPDALQKHPITGFSVDDLLFDFAGMTIAMFGYGICCWIILYMPLHKKREWDIYFYTMDMPDKMRREIWTEEIEY